MLRPLSRLRSLLASLLLASVVSSQSTSTGISLDLASEQSIRDAASTVAFGLMSWYNGNRTGGIPGLLPGPYYWWESGAMMMTMIDYWYYTGDATYNQVVTDGILFQVGPRRDFMTPNQTASTGNDDQAYWSLATLDAAEMAFPNPPSDKPQWLALSQAVFNTQVPRWDSATCAGGLRWQVFPFNAGYHYKNTISNMAFFTLGARLALYTGNTTYSDWALRAWDWQASVGLIDRNLHFYDGTDAANNCTDVNLIEWTYNAGIALHGAAAMWNRTSDPLWHDRIDRILDGIAEFFPAASGGNIMVEIACEELGTCNQDQRSFKGYLARWLAGTVQWAPWTAARITPWLRGSAAAAARSCSGGSSSSAQPGRTCGLKWTTGAWDGSYGPGEQMNALSVIGANLVSSRPAPVTQARGGISRGDPAAGGRSDDDPIISPALSRPTTGADAAGAGILTALLLIVTVGGALWMCTESSDWRQVYGSVKGVDLEGLKSVKLSTRVV